MFCMLICEAKSLTTLYYVTRHTQVMNTFPVEMQGDIAMHLHREILALPVFEHGCQGCLKSIALGIRSMFCAPGEFLVHKGDTINYIYFLVNGSMEILKDDMVVAILGKKQIRRCEYVHLDHRRLQKSCLQIN